MTLTLIYSLGICAEHVSDRWTDQSRYAFFIYPIGEYPSDNVIRAEAFVDVYAARRYVSELQPVQQKLLSETAACLQAYKHWSELEKDPGCECILSHTRSLYYEAKNTTYRDPNYFEELERIQDRVNFARSVAFAFGLLLVSLVMSTILACSMRFNKVSTSFSKLSNWVLDFPNRSSAL